MLPVPTSPCRRRADGGGPFSWMPRQGGPSPAPSAGGYARGVLAGVGGELYSWRYRLPPGLTCERCVLWVRAAVGSGRLAGMRLAHAGCSPRWGMPGAGVVEAGGKCGVPARTMPALLRLPLFTTTQPALPAHRSGDGPPATRAPCLAHPPGWLAATCHSAARAAHTQRVRWGLRGSSLGQLVAACGWHAHSMHPTANACCRRRGPQHSLPLPSPSSPEPQSL